MALFEIKREDLAVRRGPRKQSGPVAAKYRDPLSGATWSGRGRAPRWMADQERENCLIAELRLPACLVSIEPRFIGPRAMTRTH
ncbi:H-NS histone family protein [Caballeronia sp. SEWSISQ10-4 2]|nr:H-NS histone family protein [Caballeronia sp. SEWSISQ10-4 2]